jgi:hypothetical protein
MMFDHDDFDRDFKRTGKMVNAVFVITLVLAIAMFGGIAFVIYKALAFFGIL